MNFKTTVLLLILGFLYACSKDNDVTTPRNLQEYLDVNSSLILDEVIACAARSKTPSTVFIYYYPIENVSDIRYYETDSINQNKTDFSLYKRKLLPQSNAFGEYLQKFTRTQTTKEKWCLVTYKTNGKLHKSNPIKIQNLTKPTEWKDTVRIEYPQTLQPKFSWDDGGILENTIYFQVITDADNNFLSGTYTTDKWFQYYNVSNVVLNITTQTPPFLILDNEYNFTTMGISNDNWVNLIVEKTFIAQ